MSDDPISKAAKNLAEHIPAALDLAGKAAETAKNLAKQYSGTHDVAEKASKAMADAEREKAGAKPTPPAQPAIATSERVTESPHPMDGPLHEACEEPAEVQIMLIGGHVVTGRVHAVSGELFEVQSETEHWVLAKEHITGIRWNLADYQNKTRE